MDLQKLSRLNFIALFLLISITISSCGPWEKAKTKASSLKEDIVETVKVYLSSIPLVRRWVKLPPPPKELHRSTEEKISQLKLSRAQSVYPDEYEMILRKWEEANRDYQRKLYRRAEKKLENVQRDAERLLKRIEEEERAKKERALALYKRREEELLARLPKRDEERLRVRIYLWKLRNLIELGKYEEFEKEIEKSPL